MRHPFVCPPQAGQYFEHLPACRKSCARFANKPTCRCRGASARCGGADAQLLADFLVVHPTAELSFFALANDFIHPVGQQVELADHFFVLPF